MQAILYLLFNEGYLAGHADEAIRRELCDETVRLTTLLAEHPVGAIPGTYALLALMHLHANRQMVDLVLDRANDLLKSNLVTALRSDDLRSQVIGCHSGAHASPIRLLP